MTEELVRRLRGRYATYPGPTTHNVFEEDVTEAADTIERLRRENAELRRLENFDDVMDELLAKNERLSSDLAAEDEHSEQLEEALRVTEADLAAAQKEKEAEQRETESIHQIRLDLLKKWKALSADYDRLTETMHRHADAAKQFLREAEAADEAANFWRAKVDSLQRDLSASHQREEQMRRALERYKRLGDLDTQRMNEGICNLCGRPL